MFSLIYPESYSFEFGSHELFFCHYCLIFAFEHNFRTTNVFLFKCVLEKKKTFLRYSCDQNSDHPIKMHITPRNNVIMLLSYREIIKLFGRNSSINRQQSNQNIISQRINFIMYISYIFKDYEMNKKQLVFKMNKINRSFQCSCNANALDIFQNEHV